jgi:probable DNA repair protein
MSASALDAALAAGSWIVTPGERLAREIGAAFDAEQRRRGAAAWPTSRALSWNAWLDRLWLAAVAGSAFARPPVLVAPAVATELWRSVIADAALPLLSVRGAARGAARAWHTFHAWRSSTDEHMPADGMGGGDSDVFLKGCAAYRRRLDALAAIDRAGLPDALSAHASARWLAGFGDVMLYGFDATTPQQERLVTALRAAGVTIERAAGAGVTDSRRMRSVFASPREELASVLAAARSTIEADGSARVGIVVADLEERRDAIEALAEEVLCPWHLEHCESAAARPYAISLGRALSAVPIVAAALDLIALGCGEEVDALRAARALRTPYLADADARGAARAAIELRWRASCLLRTGFTGAAAALREVDPALGERWRAASRPSTSPKLPREWARAWTGWLAALGWPGSRALSSDEWQAREAWMRLLGTFASLGPATGRVAADAALARLEDLAADQIFQPQASIPPIRILGVEEALGLAFDAAWLVGFDDERWPPPLRPNAWLPLGWQRARGVPEATPPVALARARRITAALATIAPSVNVSHASTVDGSERSIAPLFANWPGVRPPDGAATRSVALFRSRRIVEVSDSHAPPVTAGTRLRGGANLIESQSACPFQAFARYRLGVARAATMSEGIGPLERGTLLHAALAAFWTQTEGSVALAALAPAALTARTEAAAVVAIGGLDRPMRAALPGLVVDGERRRLATTLDAWLERCERPRPPFRVVMCEGEVDAVIEGVALTFRVDRIDALQDGTWAIIDYKSGYASPPRQWFDARPRGTQLASYAIAAPAIASRTLDAAATGPGGEAAIGALAFAQVRAGAFRVLGMAADAASWPGLDDAATVRGQAASWTDALSALTSGVEALVREVRDGYAAVSPRDASACRSCDLHALCRIRDLDDGAEGDADGADEMPGSAGDGR